ncbi:serine/arginine repetitive matrix protein 4 [Triplophysa rosa]|uniref:serine/arginine repetitive matrix protein 4 n=1 Tax=Triplophysa rosa TaxID=992332 RepID=UPI002545F40E|nr:serine/arginine repetitive matrix protein 4 [Triplophysa rosa]
MEGVLLGEKQLFEKFWMGTFKAVAMPRPESIIVASITARRAVTKLETAVNLSPKDNEEKAETKDTVAKPRKKNGHIKHRRRKHHSHRRDRSVSSDADLSPRPMPKAKKKKRKKSERKRRRHRSPSCSPSPVRKKKKKSSKKRKRHRSASRKGRHNGSSPRRKKKEDKKHKRRSRSHPHRRHRRRKAEIRSSSYVEHRDRSEDCEKSSFPESGHSSADHRGDARRSAIKLTSKISSKCCCRFPASTVSLSHRGVEGLNKMAIVQDSLSVKGKGHAEYDSGNDTSSPPSSKTGITRSKVVGNEKVSCQELTSSEKLRLVDGDNASDSGNSLTSYDSLGKPVLRENTPHTFSKLKGEDLRRCSDLERTQSPHLASNRNRSPSYDRYQNRTRPRRRSVSSQSRYLGRYSRSRSLTSGRRSYSRSSSHSLDSRSLSSASSCRSVSYSPDRFRERKRRCSSCERRKRSRRRPCSPMRKRRRDSPSHLEARRITSARKRPIPYHRPSPSISSRSSSLLSWHLFSLNRSRSRSRSRSRTYSSYRSYSRSSSWNSVYSRRSRSRSYDSVSSYSRARP